MLQGPRRILVIVVSLVAVQAMTPIAGTAALATAVAAPSIDQPPLAQRGDRSPTVKRMQQALVKAGVTVAGGVDGVFGAGTEAAVRDYQTRRGLTVTGTLDVPTATVLGLLQGAPLLSRGARGDAVKAVQQQLMTVGLALKGGADGVYGSATVATVKAFQKSKGLFASGALDAGTAEILANAAAATTPAAVPPTVPPVATPPAPEVPPVTPPTTAPPATPPPATPPPTTAPPVTPPATTPPATTPNAVLLSLGSRGDAVKTMQSQLIAVGITVFGGADGVFGTATQTALKQFQTRVGLPATGTYDTATKAALVAAAPAPPAPSPGTVVLAAFPVAASCAFTDTFGAPRSGGRKHQGVDIIVASGTPIYAVMDGTISKKQLNFAGSLGGNALWLTAAGGTYFYYAHLSAFAPGIELGSVVTAGMLIGYVGATGNASVAHLHFEVHPAGGAAVDPYPIVKAASSC
ncbi:MAG: peptidoglycan-binding protein [Actinomycetia bacterium]|nr:peptidoglycan-binding protein [Actinomycetes bacterium]